MKEQDQTGGDEGLDSRPIQELLEVGAEVAGREELTFRDAVARQDLGMAAVTGYWGQELDVDQLRDAVEEHIGPVAIGRNFAGDSGFERSWWGGALAYREIAPFQMEIARQAILQAAGALDVGIDQISRIGVASTIPFSNRLALQVRESLGLGEKVEALVSAAACNSSAILFDQSLLEPQTDDKFHVIVGLETALSLRHPVSDPRSEAAIWRRGITKPEILSMFSDQTAVVMYQPSRLQLLRRITHSLPDNKDFRGGPHLGAVRTLEFVGEDVAGYGGLLKRNEYGFVSDMPDPDKSQGAFLYPPGTTKLFSTFTRQMIALFQDSLSDGNHQLSNVCHALIHPASRKIYEKTGERLEEIGLPPGLTEWCPTHVNAPAVTFGLEMARHIPRFKQGEEAFFMFFGATATGQIALAKIL